jgi:formate dehydrogenase major subunit
MDIPGMIRHISAGRMKDAIATVKDRIALPAALGRICPEICEKGCRRASYDASVSICMLKRFVADADLASETPYLPPCKPSTGKKVAIVGSGPTGLAGAYYLLQEGHDCTVFDENARPGGMLRYGVTPDRLPNAVLDAEIGLIERLGVRFEMESHVGSV